MSWLVTDSPLTLVDRGRQALNFASSRMPVLAGLHAEVLADRPLAGQRISGCVHLTKETGVLVELLAAAGAEVAWTGGDEVSTQDEVAAALAAGGIQVFGQKGMATREVVAAVHETLHAFDDGPTLVIDNGARMIGAVLEERSAFSTLWAATEKTTEGSRTVRRWDAQQRLDFPVLCVNDLVTKWEIDNTYGTGQSTIDGMLRATGALMAGKRFVVCGFGHVGRGVALRAAGMGARVVVACRSARTAVKARLAGFDVQPLWKAMVGAHFVCTATGYPDIVTGRHLDLLPSGAVLCNTGHSVTEIVLTDLQVRTKRTEQVRPQMTRHHLTDGRHLDLLSGGGLVNLGAGEGNPSEVMDVTFANQTLAVLRLVVDRSRFAAGIHEAGPDQDREVAVRALRAMGIRWDHDEAMGATHA